MSGTRGWIRGLLPLLLLGGTAAPARADVMEVTVAGQANIFGAGHAFTPNDGGGGGILPPWIALTSNDRVITVTGVTGTVAAIGGGDPANATGAGGYTTFQGAAAGADVASTFGISGVVQPDRAFSLLGVFLGDSEPTDPAPMRLGFSAVANDPLITPELRQTFVIGDGRTGDGRIEQFLVPDGATRLFLGFADAFNNGTPFHGPPGYYGDNSGALTVQLSAVPEPASVVLVGLGVLGLLGGFGRQLRSARR